MKHHDHLIVRAVVHKPPNDVDYIQVWLKNLVEAIGMKILRGPYAVYSDMEGNRGLTVACIIETSHIVLHVWDEDEPSMLQLDVYSCAPVERDVVFEFLKEFEPDHVDYKFLDRSSKFIEIKPE